MDTLNNYQEREVPFFGKNKSGLPLGDEETFREILPSENLDEAHDELVEINDEVLTRAINVKRGWTDDSKLYLRKPALELLKEYDRMLKEAFGWRVRVVDPYRPWTIQKKGFCWGVQKVVQNQGGVWEDFVAMAKRCLGGKGTPEEIEKVLQCFQDGDEFFSFVKPLAYDASKFVVDVPELLISGAANFGWVDLPLDKYALTPHSTGGVADLEWIDEKTDLLINVGVPVDTQGLPSAFPYFEDKVAPVLKPKVQGTDLQSLDGRKKYYKEMIRKNEPVQEYLKKTGVTVEQVLESDESFDELWNAIQKNRRLVANMAAELGIIFYGLESWHADFHNERGGVDVSKGVNGGPGYAIHIGKKSCAWGNATKLWEKLC